MPHRWGLLPLTLTYLGRPVARRILRAHSLLAVLWPSSRRKIVFESSQPSSPRASKAIISSMGALETGTTSILHRKLVWCTFPKESEVKGVEGKTTQPRRRPELKLRAEQPKPAGSRLMHHLTHSINSRI